MDDAPQDVSPRAPGAIDWSAVREEISCPLCSYNLRGVGAPRCPECGFAFEWEALTDPARRWHPYLFEHHPGRNRWSFFMTLRGGLRPRRFWSELRPEQDGNLRRLLIYLIVYSTPLLAMLVAMLISTIGLTARSLAHYQSVLTKPPTWTAERWKAHVDASYPLFPSAEFFDRWWRWNAPALSPVIVPLSWPVLTFLTLMVFRASMRRARVRVIHVLRCAVYGCDLIGIYALVLCAYLALGHLRAWLVQGMAWGALDSVLAPAGALVGMLGIVLLVALWHRLGTAYRSYLRFDRPFLTVLASQGIVALFSVTWVILMLLSF